MENNADLFGASPNETQHTGMHLDKSGEQPLKIELTDVTQQKHHGFTPGKPLESRRSSINPVKRPKEISTQRLIYFNSSTNNQLSLSLHSNNYIRTTKYTLWSFLPMSLLYQFRREANVYFLMQAILNSIPAISAMNPLTAYLPLAFVLGVSMFRDGLEDYQRYKSDVKTNRMPIKFIRKGRVEIGQAKEVQVGDTLLINENEEFPSDMVVVATSQPDAGCYIQTSSLDGEKNLKIKKAPKNLEKLIPSGGEFHPQNMIVSGQVDAEPPNGNLYSFNGNLYIGKKKYFPLSHEQLLLKGTVLKNTKWVIGTVVYTGRDTRIMMNSQSGAHKVSSVERMMNLFTIQIFIVQLILTLSIAILGGFWHSEATEIISEAKAEAQGETDEAGTPVHFYIEFSYSSIIEGFFTFIRYFQLLNTLIPISLFVTAEMIKFFIAKFIAMDVKMFNKRNNQGTEVKNMSIIEDLGMLNYIFTDKTGTLTCNQMEFKSMCIGEKILGPRDVDPAHLSQLTKSEAKRATDHDPSELPLKNIFNKQLFRDLISGKNDSQKVSLRVASEKHNEVLHISSYKELVKEFMTVMSVAHEVVAQDPTIVAVGKDDNDDESVVQPSKLVYQGPSPDEVTLVEFARELGFTFVGSNDKHSSLNVKSFDNQDMRKSGRTQISNTPEADDMVFDRQNTSLPSNMNSFRNPSKQGEEDSTSEIKFEVEHRMDFTSTRKRMSILVRDPRDNRFKLYIKGADQEIEKRLDPKGQSSAILKKVQQFTNEASEMGLRTLWFGIKVLEEQEVHRFQLNLEKAGEILFQKEERLEQIYSELESNLVLLGATAVEDRLQEMVPEAIHDFQRANIKVWMLTGDKFETAKNIGLSCKLIQHGDQTYELKNKEDVARVCSPKGVQENESLMKKNQRRVLIVQNEALAMITSNSEFRFNFIKISKTCEAVICCRVSPKQKADVVRMIKQDDKSLLTMAVGDGNNDVSMINEAHVGIGLYGHEGLRAVQASDFALPDFKQLWRLIFVHGRMRYASITQFILYFFYKNVALTMPHYFFAYACGFSAMTVFDEWYIQLYNILFTSIPVGIHGVADWDIFPDIDGQKLNEFLPLLYYEGQNKSLFNSKQFFYSLLHGLVHATIIFYGTFAAMADSQTLNEAKGYSSTMWTTSVTAFTSLVFVANINLLIRMKYITIYHWLSLLVISIGFYIIFMWGSNFQDIGWTQYAVLEAHNAPSFYLSVTFCVGTCMLIDYCLESFNVLIRTTPVSYLRILVSQKRSIDTEANKAEFGQILAKVQVKSKKRQDRRRSIADFRNSQLSQMMASGQGAGHFQLQQASVAPSKFNQTTPEGDRSVTPMLLPPIGRRDPIQASHGPSVINVESTNIHNDPNISSISESMGGNKLADSIYDRSQIVMQPSDTSTLTLQPSLTASKLPQKIGFTQQTISYESSDRKQSTQKIPSRLTSIVPEITAESEFASRSPHTNFSDANGPGSSHKIL